MAMARAYVAFVACMCLLLLTHSSQAQVRDLESQFQWFFPSVGNTGVYEYSSPPINGLELTSLSSNRGHFDKEHMHAVVFDTAKQQYRFAQYNSVGAYTRVSFVESGAGYRGIQGSFARNISTSATIDIGIGYVGGDGTFLRTASEQWSGRVGLQFRVDTTSSLLLKLFTTNHKREVSGGMHVADASEDVADPLIAEPHLQDSDSRRIANSVVALWSSRLSSTANIVVPILAHEQTHSLSLHTDGWFSEADSISSVFLLSKRVRAQPSIQLKTDEFEVQAGPIVDWLQHDAVLDKPSWESVGIGASASGRVQLGTLAVGGSGAFTTYDMFDAYLFGAHATWSPDSAFSVGLEGSYSAPRPAWYEPEGTQETWQTISATMQYSSESVSAHIEPMLSRIEGRKLFVPDTSHADVFSGAFRNTTAVTVPSVSAGLRLHMGNSSIVSLVQYTAEEYSLSLPKLYVHVYYQHDLQFGRSAVQLRGGVQYASAGKRPKLSPFLGRIYTGTHTESQWDGGYISAKARLGNADIHVNVTNIAGTLWMPFSGYPSTAQNFSVAIDWRFFD